MDVFVSTFGSAVAEDIQVCGGTDPVGERRGREANIDNHKYLPHHQTFA
jgi:hypothetical protein